MIVMNERKFVEQLLEEKPVLSRRYGKETIMNLLCKYYNNDIAYYDTVVDYMNIFFPDEFFIEHYNFALMSMFRSNKEKNLQLKEIEKIDIYENELAVLNTLENDCLKRLFFVCIVVARLKNNNGWIGLYQAQDVAEIFRLANISSQKINLQERFRLLGILERKGLLKGSKKINALNEQVLLEPKGKVGMTITSLDYLGNQYLATTKENRILCGGCGRIMKKTSNKKQYCKKCAEARTLESNRLARKKYMNKQSK